MGVRVNGGKNGTKSFLHWTSRPPATPRGAAYAQGQTKGTQFRAPTVGPPRRPKQSDSTQGLGSRADVTGQRLGAGLPPCATRKATTSLCFE